jgi:electron transfer flavoprotein beta subunit
MTLVCLKWVSSSLEPGDERFAGLSAADEVALELALRHAHAVGSSLTAITAGPASCEQALRVAVAAGASRAVRLDLPAGAASADVAACIAAWVTTERETDTIWCGDYSPDRGSGSVPAFIAARLGWAQALGLVGVAHLPDGGLQVLRRLDGGRRERLAVAGRSVLSVEGSITHLRRASLSATLAADRAAIDVVPSLVPVPVTEERLSPYRPRARALAAPSGAAALDRVRALTDASGSPARGETVTAEPDVAARRIIEALRSWGYLADG